MIIITRKQPTAEFRVIYKIIIEMTLTLWTFLRIAAVAIGALGTNTTLTRAGTAGLPAARSVNVTQSRARRRKYGGVDLLVIIEMTLTLWTFLRIAAVAIGALGTNTTPAGRAGAAGLPAARPVNVNNHGAGEQRMVPCNCSRSPSRDPLGLVIV